MRAAAMVTMAMGLCVCAQMKGINVAPTEVV